MKELQVEALTKTFGEKTLFDKISFLIHDKDKIGLIGVNGTGKSTLLSILAGKETSDAGGKLSFSQNYTIRYLSQAEIFDPTLSVLDAVFSADNPLMSAVKSYEHALLKLEEDGLNLANQKTYNLAEKKMNEEDAWSADTNAKIILQKLGIQNINQKMGELSGGQQKRVALAQVLIQEPDLLLLDEPTNHLDFSTISWLQSYLNQYQGAFLVITHDRYFLDQVTNRIFELSHGELIEYKGNYESYLLAKSEREETELQQEKKRKQLYKQELAWMRAGVKARGTKQQARITRFNELKGQVQQNQQEQEIEINLASKRLGKKVLELKDVSYTIDHKPILQNFDLLIQANERLGITGKNGAGKSTLLNILAGRLKVDNGEYSSGETVNLAYYTQQNEQLDPQKRIIQYLQEIAEEVVDKAGVSISISEMLERFLFPRGMHGSLIGKLSGGEKRRLFLLKLLISKPNVLLLDEPTNDLDIDTLTVLEDFLQQFGGAVISVSHDRYFLDKTANKLLIFKGDGLIDSYYGTMEDYLEKSKIKDFELSEKKNKKKTKEKNTLSNSKHKLTYMEKKEWATIEEEIEQVEQEILIIETAMTKCEQDFTQLQELQQELEQKNIKLEEKLQRWEYLSEFE